MRILAAVLLTALLALGTTSCQEADQAVDEAQQGARDAAGKAEKGAQDAAEKAEQGARDAGAEAQKVDWGKYPDQLRKKIDSLAAQDNCDGLNAQLDKLDPGEDTALIAYLKAKSTQVGCR